MTTTTDLIARLQANGFKGPQGPLIRQAADALTAELARLREALEPNLFWDDENPEDSFTSIEDLADYIGERAISLKVRTARSLPDAWVSAVNDEEDGWVVKYHDTQDEANAEVTAARALSGGGE